MNKKYLKDKIIEKLEKLDNDIDIFTGGVGEKLGQLQSVMDEDDEFENQKDEEVTMLKHKFEGE
jgi:hypothetical protein